ncbi:uncharacterized protein LOC131885375 [Tigriopus californicus]|nr:uncharacterized protein LOC131885375 [Tigriopus californicus]
MIRKFMLFWTLWGTFERVLPNPLEEWRTRIESQCFFDDRMHALRCRNTDLRHIQSGIDQLIFEIFVLDINFCDVSTLMEPLIGNHSMSELRTVTLVNSGLAEIAENAFMGLEDHLEHLDLSGNRLTNVPKAILNMVKLISLDLSHNQIRVLPPGSAFNNLNTLVRLDLSENRLGIRDSRSGGDSQDNEDPWEVDSSVPAEDESISKLNPGAELSLLSFNLEPLTDTLEELDLSSNQFSGLPSQFVNRTFARLRKLNLAQNPLKALSQAAFAGMGRLEVLNLAQTRLTTFVLDGMPPVLRELQLLGNPLQCDCQARWLWLHATQSQAKEQLQSKTSLAQEARNAQIEDEQHDQEPRQLAENEQTTTDLQHAGDEGGNEAEGGREHEEQEQEEEDEEGAEAGDPKTRLKIELPPCAAPFSVKSTKLTSLKDSELCELLPGDRLPRFFRVTDKDKDSFPELTFESLHLMQVTPTSDMVVNLTWSVDEPFYETSYDWGVVFRKIGDETNPSNMFFKTKLDLARHVQWQSGWQPHSEVFEDSLEGFESDTYYEICLAAVHHSTVFYVHQSNCQEVRMLESLPSPLVTLHLQEYDTPNVTFSASETAITLEWKPFRENIIPNRAPHQFPEKSNKSEEMGVFRHISLREFGAANASEVAVVFEGFNATSPPTTSTTLRHTIVDLKPQTAYIVCFHSIMREHGEEAWEQPLEEVSGASSNLEICREIVTSSKMAGTFKSKSKSITKETMEKGSAPLATITASNSMETVSPTESPSFSSPSGGFPLTEVVAATAAASASTAIIVAILCCWCCGPRPCCSRRTSERDNEAENETRTKGNERIGYNNENKLDDGGESGSTKDENDNSTKLVMKVENMSINELNPTEVDGGFHHSYHPHHHSSIDMEPPVGSQEEDDDDDNDDDEEDQNDPEEELASNQFKSSIISVISSPSIDTVDYDDDGDEAYTQRFRSKANFQERFSDISIQGDRVTLEDTVVIPPEEKSNRTATNSHKVSVQDRPRSSSSPSKFWPSCFSANSSLYSQYDYTIHSEASPPSHLNESSHRSREIFSHHHYSNQEATSSSNQKRFPSKKKRRKSEGESHNRSHPEDPEEAMGWRKRTTFADRPPPHYTKKPPGGGILRQPSHNPVALPRFSDPAPRLVDPGPASFHYAGNSLSALGAGNYNTFSNYQFYRRPYPGNFAYMSPGEYYHGMNLVARPFDPRYAFDYSKTLGRKRRESPMATVPVLSPPNATATGMGVAMELKPINWKKVKSRGSSSHKSASDNYKMFTWSPYSSNVPVFYPEAAVFPVRLKHPNGKSLEDLRF